MSSPEAPTTSTRIKVYAACEPCRKRKVRCSGTAPCTTCQKQKVECYIDRHRRKRGPPPGTGSSRLAGSELIEGVSMPSQSQITTGHPAMPRLPGSSWERKLSFAFPSFEIYRSALCIIFEKQDLFHLGSAAVSIDLVAHLTTVFCTTVNDQQSAIILVSRFLRLVVAGKCSKSLCLAMCAVSVKFSSNRMVRSATPVQLADNFANEARNELEETFEGRCTIERIQCLAILAMFELNEGNNSQALYDINTALYLVSALRNSPQTLTDDSTAVDIIHHHLCITEALCSLEHRTLRAANPPIKAQADGETIELGTAPDTRYVLTKLVDILNKIQRLSRTDFTKQIPAPWDPNSPYMALREELEDCGLRFTEETSFTQETFNLKLKQEIGLGEYVLCSLVWHCCRIRLCRIFLPIPLSGSVSSSDDSASKHKDAISYPSAPDTIVRESIYMCNQSTKIIASICSRVLASGVFLLPPILGYCCFQGALVLINELRLKRKATFDESLGNLKTFFTVLGAIRNFFSGADKWIDTLFRVHDPKSLLQDASIPGSVLFAQYFSRFDNITEASFLAVSNLSDASTASRRIRPAVNNSAFQEEQFSHSLLYRSSKKRKKESSWVSLYMAEIESSLERIKGEIGASPVELMEPVVLSDGVDCVGKNAVANDQEFTRPKVANEDQLGDFSDVALMNWDLYHMGGPENAPLANGDSDLNVSLLTPDMDWMNFGS